MPSSCSDVCMELVENMCKCCEKYASCAYDTDLDENHFNDQLIACIQQHFREMILFVPN